MTRNEIILNKDSYNEKISLFEQKVKEIKDTFNFMKSLMTDIDGENENWKSKVGVEVHDKYKENEKKFNEISEQLDKYVVFLKDTLNNYIEEEKSEEKSLENQQQYLDVNEQ